MQNYMVVALLTNNSLCFYDLHGEKMVDTYSPGHHVHLLALAPRIDEVIITTLGTDRVVKMARMENKKIRVNLTDDAAGATANTLPSTDEAF